MQRFNALEDLYDSVNSMEPDNQVLLLLKNREIFVPIGVILSQYKYCQENKLFDSTYQTLREALCELTSVNAIEKLEVLHGF